MTDEEKADLDDFQGGLSRKISPNALREGLRMEPDTTFVNELGEHVWLKEVTDLAMRALGYGVKCCCEVDDPCDWHGSFPRYLRGPREVLEKLVPDGDGLITVRRSRL